MKTPNLVTDAQLDAIAESRDIAKGTLGMIVLRMLEEGDEISRAAIMSELEACAAGPARPGLPSDQLAKGALRLIARLPSAPEARSP